MAYVLPECRRFLIRMNMMNCCCVRRVIFIRGCLFGIAAVLFVLLSVSIIWIESAKRRYNASLPSCLNIPEEDEEGCVVAEEAMLINVEIVKILFQDMQSWDWISEERKAYFEDVLMHYSHPEAWIGKEYYDLWNQLKLAMDAAALHFEGIPTDAVPIYRLIPLVMAQFEYVQTHRGNESVIIHEFESHDNVQEADKDTIFDLYHYSQFANLAYEHPETIRSSLRAMDFELLQWEPDVGPYKPCYFVGYQAKQKLAVISIRGTSSFQDLLTDILHTPEPFSFGNSTVHAGMHHAAKFIINRTHTLIKDFLLPMGYELVITGHSLGAGTSQLVAIIYHEKYNYPVRCYAFAPPPTFNRNFARDQRGYIRSMVYNDDIIPRWNFGIIASTAIVFRQLDQEIQEHGMTMEEFYQNLDFNARSRELRHLIEDYTVKQGESRDMHITGTIYYFVKSNNDDFFVRVVENNFPSLRRIEFTTNLLTDHSLDQYIACLNQTTALLGNLKN